MRAASLGLFICSVLAPCYGRYWNIARYPNNLSPHVKPLVLCASNGVTYKTHCAYLYAKSYYPELEVLHLGACDHGDLEYNYPWYSDNEYNHVVKPTKRPRKHSKTHKQKKPKYEVTEEDRQSDSVTEEEYDYDVTDENGVTEEEDSHPGKGSKSKNKHHNVNNVAKNKNVVIMKKRRDAANK